MPTSPPEAPIASSWASVRLRLAGHSAWAPECEAISGASSSRATSQKPASLRWLRSTAMPSSAQRRTSPEPACVSPGPVSGELGWANGTPWANAFGRLQTGPSERRPAACSSSSACSSGSIASAPSMWATAASVPAARAASRSPGARAIAHVALALEPQQAAERAGHEAGREVLADRRGELGLARPVRARYSSPRSPGVPVKRRRSRRRARPRGPAGGRCARPRGRSRSRPRPRG